MVTETTLLPGFGVVVDAESGDTTSLPGFGTIVARTGAPALDNDRISSMHFQRHYEPIAMGE